MAITYVDALNVAIGAVEDVEVAEKLTALRAQIAKKKGSSKPTKTQIENEAVKEEILAVLADADEPMRIGEIKAELDNDYTPQKLSALLKALTDGGKVVKTYEKKVAYFALA